MIVLAATETSSISKSTLVYENTTVALGNVQKFTTEHVKLYQDPRNGEVSIPLKFYRFNKPCDSLQSKEAPADGVQNYTLPLYQSQTQVVMFHDYLLPESELNYNICAVTNQLNGTKYHVDFYVAEDLDENLAFNPDKSYHQDIGLVYNSDLQQPNYKCFTPIAHKLTKRGYYSVILLLPLQNEVPVSNLSIWYSRNDNLKVVDTSQLKSTCSGNTGSKNNPCKISIGSREHLISVFCIVAEVGTSEYNSYTHIQATLTDWDAGQIWFYVLGGFVIVAALLLSLLVLKVITCLCKI